MSESLPNLTSFTPEEYTNDWTYIQLAARYIGLRAEYLALRTLVDGAIAAHPFERERTIHNLQNARLRLENEKEQLCAQKRQLERANLTNRNINCDLLRRYSETQETLNIVLQAQSQGDREARAQHAKIERLQEENENLRWQIEMLVKARDEDAGSLAGLWNKGDKSQSEVGEMGKTAENLDGWVDKVITEQEKLRKAEISGEPSCCDDNDDDDYNDDHFDI